MSKIIQKTTDFIINKTFYDVPSQLITLIKEICALSLFQKNFHLNYRVKLFNKTQIYF